MTDPESRQPVANRYFDALASGDLSPAPMGILLQPRCRYGFISPAPTASRETTTHRDGAGCGLRAGGMMGEASGGTLAAWP